jgi:glycosyltransferase involved in cell wall biosynthesis
MAVKKLVILIFAYNEESTIFNVIQDIPSINSIKNEIIVVNDGSIDKAEKNAKKAGAKVINNPTNLGLGYSFKRGLLEGLKRKGDLIAHYEYEERILKKLGNYLLSFFISKILLHQNELYDSQSSFRAFDINLGRFLIKNLKSDYNYAQEILILEKMNNFRIDQIPIKCYKRKSGDSKLINNVFSHLGKILWSSIISIR